jgi:Domain of unknown function (DUF4267)
MQTQLSDTSKTFWRSTGSWMVVPMVVLMLLNFGRTLLDPIGFAAYLGLPLQNVADFGLIQVYGLRALFIGLFASYLLWREKTTELKWFAWLAIVMPVGDACLVWQAGGTQAIIFRHCLTAAYLLVVGVVLHRSLRKGI